MQENLVFQPMTLTKGIGVQVPTTEEKECVFNSRTQANANLGTSASTSMPVEPRRHQIGAQGPIVEQATLAGEVALADRHLEGRGPRTSPRYLADSSSQANAKEGKHVPFCTNQQHQQRQHEDAGNPHQPGIGDPVVGIGAREGTKGTEGQGVEVVKGALVLKVNPAVTSQPQFAFQ